MNNKTFIFVLTLLLTAALTSSCATVKESYAPDGRKAFTLNCSGTARGWDKCYKAAGDICKEAGYDIVDRTSEDSAQGISTADSLSAFSSFTKSNERSMMIACKK